LVDILLRNYAVKAVYFPISPISNATVIAGKTDKHGNHIFSLLLFRQTNHVRSLLDFFNLVDSWTDSYSSC